MFPFLREIPKGGFGQIPPGTTKTGTKPPSRPENSQKPKKRQENKKKKKPGGGNQGFQGLIFRSGIQRKVGPFGRRNQKDGRKKYSGRPGTGGRSGPPGGQAVPSGFVTPVIISWVGAVGGRAGGCTGWDQNGRPDFQRDTDTQDLKGDRSNRVGRRSQL